MEASSNRRRRYARQSPPVPRGLTPARLALLSHVGDYGVASLPQLARRTGLREQACRRHMRLLFDGGLVEVNPVGRTAVAEPEAANDASLLHGSAPNVFTATRAGLRVLEELGLGETAEPPPRYGPLNSLFLRHTLAVVDVRVWLELCALRYQGHGLARWVQGPQAEMDLGRAEPPRYVRPDAWFVYRLGERSLVGLVEADRGTERGSLRWKGKLLAYQTLYAGRVLKEVTGFGNARALVVAPDANRRDRLAEFVARNAPAGLAARFWLAERSALRQPDVGAPVWVQPGSAELRPLIPPEMLQGK